MPPLCGHPRNLDPTLLRVELALRAGWTLDQIEDELFSAGDLDEDFASAVWLYAWSRADGLAPRRAGQRRSFTVPEGDSASRVMRSHTH